MSDYTLEEIDAAIKLKESQSSPEYSLEDIDAAIKLKESEKPRGLMERIGGAVNTVSEPLNYSARVARTAIGAALSPDISASDVGEQASHLYKENASKPATSGKKVLDMIKLPVVGVNPNYKGEIDKNPTLLKALAGTGEGAQQVAGGLAEVAMDPLWAMDSLFKIAGTTASIAGKGISAATDVVGGGLGSLIKGAGKTLEGVRSENVLGSAGRATGRIITGLAEKTSPKIASNFERMTKIAEEMGIPANEVGASNTLKFGRDTTVGRLTRSLAEGPGGDLDRAAHYALKDKIVNGINESLNKYSAGRVSHVNDYVSAGQTLSSDFEKAQDALRKSIDYDRGMVYKQQPDFLLSDAAHSEALSALESNAKKLSDIPNYNVEEAVIKQADTASILIARAYEGLSKTQKAEDVHRTLQQIGRMAFESRRTDPAIKSILKDAYFDLAKVYDGNTASILGPEIAKNIEQNNKLWHEWYKSGDDFANTLSSGSDPEKIFKRLVKSGGSQEITKYRNFMAKNNPEGLQNMKTLLSRDIFNAIRDTSGPNKTISFEGFAKKLTDPNIAGKLKILYTPEEIQKMKDMAELGISHGTIHINPSQTEVLKGTKNFISESAQRSEQQMLLDNLKRRAVSPEGIPLSDIQQGKMLMPPPSEGAQRVEQAIKSRPKANLLNLIRAGNNMNNQRRNK